MEPRRTNKGMTCGQNNYLEVQQCIPPQCNELKNVVIQESAWKATPTTIQPTSLQPTFLQHKEATKATTATKPLLKAMAREKNVEENGRGPMIAESNLEPSDVYLVLTSYAEPYKQDIKNIVKAEKAKLCSNSLFKKCLENIDFKIAFANSKNMF